MDHHARVMDRLADGFEREPVLPIMVPKMMVVASGGEDALDGERDAEHLAVLLFDVGGEVVDDAADTLVVNVGVAVRQASLRFSMTLPYRLIAHRRSSLDRITTPMQCDDRD